MEESEIIEYLKDNLDKEKKLSDISDKFKVSEYEILGLIYKLRENGIDIHFYDKDNETYLINNNHPDLTKENTYYIDCDSSLVKFAVISDLRIGSKYEQIGILNDMYRKFLEMGIKYVFITGNLVEGSYNGKEQLEFGKSLITNNVIGQVNHLIEYYPKVDGIKTMFITGNLDHKCSKEVNIGAYINRKREDLIYLGPKSCTVHFNNASFRFEQLKDSEAYTISYPAQKYSRSMSDNEKYDAIFLGGGRNFQHFPSIRGTQIFSIPSVVERTPKMAQNNQTNTLGAYLFDLELDKNKKMKRIVGTIMPYSKPSKTLYLNLKKLDENKKIDYSNEFDKIYNYMKKEESLESLAKRLGLNKNELYGVILCLKESGREITIEERDNELYVFKKITKKKEYNLKPRKEELNKKEILVVSDTHYGSIYSQPSMVNTAVYEAYNRGITDIIHAGDITDGDYSRIRPIHNSEVFLYGATGQLEYTLKTLPKYNGMKWHIVTGSHDQTHFFNYGVNIGEELEKRRDDIEFLGQDIGYFNIDNLKIEVFHPGGGASRILSTKPQNGIDQIPGASPNISIRGHYHKAYYMMYRDSHIILCPCNVDQSSFMMKNELPNLMGDYFLTIYYDDTGYVHYLECEPMIFNNEDVRKNDFENPKKYLKNKIYTKRKI